MSGVYLRVMPLAAIGHQLATPCIKRRGSDATHALHAAFPAWMLVLLNRRMSIVLEIVIECKSLFLELSIGLAVCDSAASWCRGLVTGLDRQDLYVLPGRHPPIPRQTSATDTTGSAK